jgi:hypothetical protein
LILLTIISRIYLLGGDPRKIITLIIRHAPDEACASVEDYFIEYFYAVEIVRNKWFHFYQVDYYQEGCEIHVEELHILTVVAKVKDDSKEEATKEEYCR